MFQGSTLLDQALARIGGESTCESFATRRALDEQDSEDRQEADRKAAVALLSEEFLRAAADCQADKFAPFAPRVLDRKTGRNRLQTMSELLFDTVLESYDFRDRAMQVLLDAAAGRGTQREAQQLLAELAAEWAGEAA